MRVYQVEATNQCNLRCSFCPVWKPWAQRERGFMNLDLLERIDFGDTKYVEVQFGGESALHPDLDKISSYIRHQGILVGISTNGTLPVNFSAFDIITVTRDEERKPSEDFLNNPNVYLQTLGDNHPYEDYSHERLSSVDVSKCVTPFNYVSIHWDGDVVPCCHCFGKQHVFGNLYDMTMEEIENSHKRKIFLEQLPNNYICKYCEFPNPHLIHIKLLKWFSSIKEIV